MVVAKKEKALTLTGLCVFLVGGLWFTLTVATGVFDGLEKMFGIFLGAGLGICGLIIAGVYFFRWYRIKKLVKGENLLARWNDDDRPVLIARDCAYVDGNLHIWAAWIGRLEKVDLQTSSNYLEIRYSISKQTRDVITGNWKRIWESNTFSVHVPENQLAAITTAVAELQSQIRT